MGGVMNEKFPGGADAQKNCWNKRNTQPFKKVRNILLDKEER